MLKGIGSHTIDRQLPRPSWIEISRVVNKQDFSSIACAAYNLRIEMRKVHIHLTVVMMPAVWHFVERKLMAKVCGACLLGYQLKQTTPCFSFTHTQPHWQPSPSSVYFRLRLARRGFALLLMQHHFRNSSFTSLTVADAKLVSGVWIFSAWITMQPHAVEMSAQGRAWWGWRGELRTLQTSQRWCKEQEILGIDDPRTHINMAGHLKPTCSFSARWYEHELKNYVSA